MTNFHKLGDLKQQEFIHSQFWGPEILTRGEGRATPPPKAAGKNSSCLLWFPVAPGDPLRTATSAQSLPPPHVASPCV